MKRELTSVSVGLIVLASLGACSSGPDPEPAANNLAKALESGNFKDVPLRNDAEPARFTREAIDGMGGASHSVRVQEITDAEDDRNDVTLEWTWDVDSTDADWKYTSTATMELDDEWQVEWAPAIVHPKLTSGEARLVLSRDPAERGEIRGDGDEVLVTDRPVYRIGIDKTKVSAAKAGESAEELAGVVDVDAGNFTQQVEGAGDKAFVEAITLREDDASSVLPQLEKIEGAIGLPDTLPLAPTREFARPILGSVGPATEEVIKESKGQIAAGEMVGLSGLQQGLDERLRGTAGVTVEAVPGDGEGVVVYEQEAKPGKSITTTLSGELQLRAENVLAGVGPPSAVVAIDSSSGAVLAAASGAGGQGYSTATLGQYAPGSTFKVVTALALLRAGTSPDDVLDCAATIEVNGKSFKNYDDYPSSALGEISLRSAIANSCNTALIGEASRVSQDDLAAAAASLGLGGGEVSVGIGAFLGSVPTSAGVTEHAASMIGQGKVLASPLAMATVAASVAAGETVSPHLVGKAPEIDNTLKPAEGETLRDLMRAVVEEGSGLFLQDVPGDPVGAKTGTAEYGSGDPLPTHAWMIATQGDLAVAVFVEDGESGSQTAGPILEEFLTGR